MNKCKIKTIQRDLGIFRHNHAYSKPCVTLAYSEPWYIQRTLKYSELEAYSEPWDIHNPGKFRTPVYSERWHIQYQRHIKYPVKYLR